MRRYAVLILALVICVPLAAEDINSETLWKALITGNATYRTGKISYTNLTQERQQLVGRQNPPVTVLSCSDSRVPPELVFNQSLGGLFVVRAAGNVVDDIGLASMEYAVAQGWTRLIVVLAHQNCGAVVEALKLTDPPTPSLLALVTRIRGSFVGLAWNGDGNTALDTATKANARASAAWLTANSKVIRDAATDGRVRIIPAYYSLESGEVKAIE